MRKFKKNETDSRIEISRNEAQFIASALSLFIALACFYGLTIKEFSRANYIGTFVIASLLAYYSLYAVLKGRKTEIDLDGNTFSFYEFTLLGPRSVRASINEIERISISSQGCVNGVQRGLNTYSHICAIHCRNKEMYIYCTATQESIQEFAGLLSHKIGVELDDETQNVSGNYGGSGHPGMS
ncbi:MULTISPECIES: hypothetical protein [unclassified Lentimonas]|uniref:hypothetical protein n=1 Tax=unclassified Lentimonas TaxID=2630993 RepID=UPI00132916A5|nr:MULTISPECIES: hypothetical protein [unclassified Lentimonas]CAA6693681.1 Unannotated [Lentimonas sp. CC10]CAA6696079.1 Unannotated [Lentimonas sp. CC19]CAA7071688.1 Unannotated [Lentimonas sp. CC11]